MAEKELGGAVEVAVEDVSQTEKNTPPIKQDEKLSWIASAKQAPTAVAWCCYILFTCIMWDTMA